MSAGNVLRTPLAIGPVVLPNRLVSAPMERNYCDRAGHATPRYTQYLRERASAGVGLIFTEAAYVRADGKGRTHQLGAHDDSCVAPLADLVEALHAEGSLVGCELNHGGRTAQSAVSGQPNVAPSPVPCAVAGGEVPRELRTGEVYELAGAYADAAARCVAAGVDVLAIHAGHGYLIHQFMSPLYNHRRDEFADPVRFLALVIDAVRRRVPDTALGVRISGVEGVDGGLDADATFGLVSRSRVRELDFIDVSAGSYEAGQWIVQPGEWEPGYLREIARRYRALGLPIGMAGRINSPEAARMLVEDGFTDFVSVARALHADPAFAAAALRGDPYRPCIACNVCIDGLADGPVGCSVNPFVGGAGPAAPVAPIRGTAVVVGGSGPAGLTAARELALAGAAVTLAERRDEPGGDLRLAARMRSTPEFGRFLDWSLGELRRLGVEVRTRTSLEDLLHTARPDGAIDATGGEHSRPSAAHPRVCNVRDWLDDAAAPPPACVVWGADTVGMSVADTLASEGVRVLLVGMEDQIAPDSGRRAKILAVPRLTGSPHVRIYLGTSVEAITAERVRIRHPDGRTEWLDAPGPVLVSDGVVGRVGTPDTRTGWPPTETTAAPPDCPPATIRAAVTAGQAAAHRLAAQLVGGKEVV